MDEDIEKELVRIRNLSFDEMVAEGLIIPAEKPVTFFKMPTFKIKGNMTTTEILIAERRSARF
jgi:hypothetical protein